MPQFGWTQRSPIGVRPDVDRRNLGGPPSAAADDAPPVAVLLLFQARPGARAWGWSRVVLGSLGVRGVPGLRFVRALGSGHEGGFGLRPSTDRQGLFALFDSDDDADAFIDDSRTVQAYGRHAAELLLMRLRATACRGSWAGMRMAVSLPADPNQPVAALTRAAIRPRHALAFWRHSPPSEAALARVPGCRLAVGLGEAPLLRQATFSLWDNVAAMQAYSRQGAHGQAAAAAQHGEFFSESMFVRMQLQRSVGRWHGREIESGRG